MNAAGLLYSYPPHLMVESADFDGTNDYMTTGAALSGAVNSKTGIFSAWIRIDGGDLSLMYFLIGLAGSNFVQVRRNADNTLLIWATNASGTTVVQLNTTGTYATSSTWKHILASWDTSTSTGQIYVSDVSDLSVTQVWSNDVCDYAVTNWGTGARPDTGANKLNGCLAELYFAPGQYLDFSVTNNRRKFITSSLKPVYLGKDGAGPTGTAPAIYLHLDPSEALADFATNRGTGGNFTITGSLTAGSTSPSDF